MTNCLTKNLDENESLPQIRNLDEKGFPEIWDFRGILGDEANDEGEAVACAGYGSEVSAGWKAGEAGYSGRVVAACGYHRTYASYLLSRHGRRVEAGPKRIFVGDVGKRIRKKREPTYGDEERAALKKIWAIMDMICGKRLAAALPELIPKLEHWGELDVSWEVREKLLRMSRSTIDRLLAGERKKIELKRRSGTKPGTLLKQIPIRTFSDWDDARPGFVEIDLVAHCGGDPSGDFCQTLSLTDVASGWSEAQAVRNKDITYLPLVNGKFCYLAMFQDVRTKRMVGWSVASRMTAELVCEALRMGLRRGLVKRDAIIHTDRGSQYASNEFRQMLERCKLRQSMSAQGNCYDNAQAESFFSRFKTEIDTRIFGSVEEARSVAFDYIDCYYNRIRRHSTLGATIPEFERRLKQIGDQGRGNDAHVGIAEKQKTFSLNSHNRLEKPKAAFPHSHHPDC